MSTLDLDLGEALKKLFNRDERSASDTAGDKAGVGRKVSAKRSRLVLPVLVAATLVGLAAMVYFDYLPQGERLRDMRSKAQQVPQLNKELNDLTLALTSTRSKLEQAQQRYEELTRLFHTESELEVLYRHISTLALTNGLTITGINKQKDVSVYQAPIKPQKRSKSKNAPEAEYYRVPLKLDFSGSFLNYVRFRSDLAEIKKLVNIDFETIHVDQSESGGVSVNINAIISTYRMPERYLNLSKKP